MTPWSFALRLSVIVCVGLAAIGWLFAGPTLPQQTAYHDFADQRPLLGIPHALNVLSNLPFLLVGGLGVAFLLCREQAGSSVEPWERGPFLLFFLGVGLTAFGSAYYHLEPNNERLLWDRLPMAVAFMALFAAVLGERLHPRVCQVGLVPLLAAGVASVLYWHWTEQQGRGDLRFYYVVQFFPMLALPLLLLLFQPRYTRTFDFVGTLGWYVLAKVCEHPLDSTFLEVTGVVSGHTLKHLAAALAAYWLLRMLQRRVPVSLLAA